MVSLFLFLLFLIFVKDKLRDVAYLSVVSNTSLSIVSYTSLSTVSYTSLSIVSLRYPKYIETQSPVDRSLSIISSSSTSPTPPTSPASLYRLPYRLPCRPPNLRLLN